VHGQSVVHVIVTDANTLTRLIRHRMPVLEKARTFGPHPVIGKSCRLFDGH
jgi:hypothetical protein